MYAMNFCSVVRDLNCCSSHCLLVVVLFCGLMGLTSDFFGYPYCLVVLVLIDVNTIAVEANVAGVEFIFYKFPMYQVETPVT
jgi:hypothetical protein